MRFRRSFRRGGFSRKGTREQLMWRREVLTTSDAAAFGTPLALKIFTPSTFQTGSIDERWTVRRIRLSAFQRYAFSAGNGQVLMLAGGLYMDAIDAAARDPFFPTAADQSADYLSLGFSGFTYPGGAVAQTMTAGALTLDRQEAQPLAHDVRVQRKVDNDQAIWFVTNLKANATDGNPTETQHIITAYVSTLFQRTRR